MNFFVEHGIFDTYFETYEDAKIFCAERGIHPDNIHRNYE